MKGGDHAEINDESMRGCSASLESEGKRVDGSQTRLDSQRRCNENESNDYRVQRRRRPRRAEMTQWKRNSFPDTKTVHFVVDDDWFQESDVKNDGRNDGSFKLSR